MVCPTCNIVEDQLICPATLQVFISSKTGQPLAGGTVTFYRQADHSTLKDVYYQSVAGNTITYPALDNPLTLGDAGSATDPNGNDTLIFYYPYLQQGEPLCLCDSNIVDQYYVEVRNANGQLEFTRQFFPFLGNLNEPIVPTVATLENLIVNNRFWRNLSQLQANTTNISLNTLTQYSYQQYQSSGNYYYLTLAPSQHDGFTMPDFNYIRNSNTSVTEYVQFLTFPASTSTQDLTIQGDIQPEYYVSYTVSADSSGATLKVFQFPISLHIDTLGAQPFSFTIQGQCPAGASVNSLVTFYIYQYLGTNTTSPAPVQIGQVQFTNIWTKYEFTGLIFPNNQNATISTTNDDAFYLQIAMPLGNISTTINFALPSIYLSETLNDIPTNSFQTYDQIDSIISLPRTGDIKQSMNNFYPYGWAPMNGGTICNAGTGFTAPASGFAYQAKDAFPLYSLLWQLFKPYDTGSNSNPLAQMYAKAGTATNYSASPYIDWNAGNQLALTNTMGRVLMGTAPALSLSSTLYSSSFTASQLNTINGTANSGGTVVPLTITSTQSVAFGEVIKFTAASSTPTNITLTTVSYWCIPQSATTFYVATSLANAQNGVYVIQGATAGTGMTIQTQSLVLTMTNTPASFSCFVGQPVTFSTTGVLPGNLSANTVYYAVPTGYQVTGSATICVAASFSDAIKGNLIAYSSAGSPTNTITTGIPGTLTGEFNHQELVAELAGHTHQTGATSSVTGGGITSVLSRTLGTDNATALAGGNTPSNLVQSGVFMNYFIKL